MEAKSAKAGEGHPRPTIEQQESLWYSYRTYIKDIYLELPKYQHHHSSLDGDDDEIFIGRKENTDNVENTLDSSEENGNGAYLVTGYRGMGKTSLVNSILKKYKIRKKEEHGVLIRKINVNFSQTNLNESDILKQLVQNIINDIEKNPLIRISNYFSARNIFLFILFLITSLLVTSNLNKILKLLTENYEDITGTKAIAIIILAIYISTALIFIFRIIIGSFRALYIYNDYRKKNKKYMDYLFDKKFISNLNYPIRKYKILISSLITLTGIIKIINLIHLITINNGVILPSDKPLIISYLWTLILLISVYYINKNFDYIKVFSFSNFIDYLLEIIYRERQLYNRLSSLLERCNATVTSESGVQNSGEGYFLGIINKKTKIFPIANSKEIENELIFILGNYHSFKQYKKKYIIVFDELDKIETTIGKVITRTTIQLMKKMILHITMSQI